MIVFFKNLKFSLEKRSNFTYKKKLKSTRDSGKTSYELYKEVTHLGSNMSVKNGATKPMSADAELLYVMQRGGEGIDKPMVLGNNVFGTEKMVVPPMQPGEKIVQVKGGDHRSFHSAFTAAAKELSIRVGPNDVGDQQPAYFDDGTRRPSVPDELLNAECKIFVDNFICQTAFNDQEPILRFLMLLCSLKHRGQMGVYERISISASNKIKDVQEWKVAVANVPTENIDFILKVYHFAISWDGEQESLIKWAKRKCSREMKRLGTKFHELSEAVSIAHSKGFCLIDIDLTVDVPGTLDAQPFADAIERAGNTLHKNTDCGLQCVKWTPSKYDFTTPDHPDEEQSRRRFKVTAKAYNKLTETMQQGKAKMRNLDDKFSKLLNPSTIGLQHIVVDPNYYENGVTRLETTFPFDIGVIWTIDLMAELLNATRELVKPHLVVASIQDHITGMEKFVRGSTFVYYPDMFMKKQRNYYAKGVNKKAKESDSDNFPDGCITHWCNSYTKKTNGVEIRARIGTRDDHQSGWDAMSIAIAALSNAGHDVIGFISVGGDGKWIGQPDDLQHRYYRMIVIERHAVGSQLQLTTGFIHKDGVLKNTCWDAIGVCAEDIVLNPRIIEKRLFSSAKQVDAAKYVGIEISFSLANRPLINDCNSEAMEKFTGLPKRIRCPSQQHMPTEKSRWTDIQWGYNRKKPQLKFRFEGDWYWLPQKWHEDVLKYVFGKTDVECIFCWGSSSLVCEFNAVTADTTAVHMTDVAEYTTTIVQYTPIPANPQTQPIHIGTISPMKNIPISTDGIEIVSGGFKQRRGKIPSCYVSFRGMVERFWLSHTYADRFWNTRLGDRNLEPTDYNLDFLAGCRLIRPDNVWIGVSLNPNPEPRMWIVNADGQVQVMQDESAPSLTTRNATSSLDSGCLVAIEHSNKRQRIN